MVLLFRMKWLSLDICTKNRNFLSLDIKYFFANQKNYRASESKQLVDVNQKKCPKDPIRQFLHVQLCQLEMTPLLNKQKWNEVFLSGKKYLKVMLNSFFKSNLITSISGLSNELRCILALRDCETVKCQSWRSEKNFCHSIWMDQGTCGQGSSLSFFSYLQLWPLIALQLLEVQGCLAPHLEALGIERIGNWNSWWEAWKISVSEKHLSVKSLLRSLFKIETFNCFS